MARHNELGKIGEQLACDKLVGDGYAIAERNWRLGHLEIDIVAIKDGSIVFAEVKTRSDDSEGSPLEAVDARKIRHMANAADAYMKMHDDLPMDWRFDIFGVVIRPDGSTEVEHIPDAFYPPLKTY